MFKRDRKGLEEKNKNRKKQIIIVVVIIIVVLIIILIHVLLFQNILREGFLVEKHLDSFSVVNRSRLCI